MPTFCPDKWIILKVILPLLSVNESWRWVSKVKVVFLPLKNLQVGEPGQSGEWILVLKTENAHLLCPPPAIFLKVVVSVLNITGLRVSFCRCDKTFTINSLGKNLYRDYEECCLLTGLLPMIWLTCFYIIPGWAGPSYINDSLRKWPAGLPNWPV